MTERAFTSYQQAREHQLLRNDARRIRTRVKEARDNPSDAGGRWPFELLQNACDAGPASGASGISVRVGWEDGDQRTVYFEHDGAPFASQDVAALLSGGSNKEFDSTTTTGRFGTGFLATHVLSERVSVRAVLLVDQCREEFTLVLDRSGDEDAILASTLATDVALRQATPVEEGQSTVSARFTWTIDDFSTYERGATALEEALPFVFGTCPSLARVEIRRADGSCADWRADPSVSHTSDGIRWTTRQIARSSVDAAQENLEVTRVHADVEARTGAVFVVHQDGESGTVREMPTGLARIFRRFPIRGTGHLPIAMVIDGPFDVDQERRSIALAPDDRALVEAALSAIVSAVRVAFLKKARRAHCLAAIAPLTGGSSSEEAAWWLSALQAVAEKLAVLPLVATSTAMLPAHKVESFDRYADFPRPRLDDSSKVDELPLQRVWRLMRGISTCDPPDEHLASDWAAIARGWAELGVRVREVSLRTLATDARGGATTIGALETLATAEWLPDFLDAIGLAWNTRGGHDNAILERLIPNQEGALCDPSKLERDGGVPEELKVIAEELGVGVRPLLLDQGLAAAAQDPRWPHLLSTLERALPRTRTKEVVVEACVKSLETKLPLQKRLEPDGRRTAGVAARFLAFIWGNMGASAASLATRVPLLTANDDCDRGAPTRKMMLPACVWRPRSRPYASAWPTARVLGDTFATPPLPDALVAWNIAFRDPLTELRASELRGGRLAAMLSDPSGHEGLVVDAHDESFTAIALLQPEVLNRCQDNRDHAKLLMGFVVDCLARDDQSWRLAKTMRARREGVDVTLQIRNALWLGDLYSRSWVPARGDDGSPIKVPPSAVTLRGLLEPAWLVDNPGGIELLTKCFGFDALELQLLGATRSDQQRQALRDQLARIVQASDGRLELLEAVMADIQARRQRESTVQALRNFGLAVQEAVRVALEAHGLSVRFVDHGFDYAVAVAEQSPLEDLALAEFEVDEWLVEVKATTRDEVALTPLQARTAAARPDRFVLCVVPLSELPGEKEEVAQLVEKVRESARMVSDIGPDAATTTALVDSAAKGPVGLRNDQQLRYAVREPRWRRGVPLADWVATFVKTRHAMVGKL